MISALKILAVAALWYIKSSSLPKFYFGILLLIMKSWLFNIVQVENIGGRCTIYGSLNHVTLLQFHLSRRCCKYNHCK